jgi:hypothetical protein
LKSRRIAGTGKVSKSRNSRANSRAGRANAVNRQFFDCSVIAATMPPNRRDEFFQRPVADFQQQPIGRISGSGPWRLRVRQLAEAEPYLQE